MLIAMSKHSKATPQHPSGAPVRGAGVITEREHDPYRTDQKLPEPTACPECHASYQDGRWGWASTPKFANKELCPACRRIRDRFPAGWVTIEGEFFREHRDELMQLVNHHAEHAKKEHALQRIIDVENSDDGVVLTTTDMHLARGIAQALYNAYRGDLHFRYNEGQTLLRAYWKR